MITYYQRQRHIFGDLKVQIFDGNTKLLEYSPRSKHRGLNRISWSMHLTAADSSSRGPARSSRQRRVRA